MSIEIQQARQKLIDLGVKEAFLDHSSINQDKLPRVYFILAYVKKYADPKTFNANFSIYSLAQLQALMGDFKQDYIAIQETLKKQEEETVSDIINLAILAGNSELLHHLEKFHSHLIISYLMDEGIALFAAGVGSLAGLTWLILNFNPKILNLIGQKEMTVFHHAALSNDLAVLCLTHKFFSFNPSTCSIKSLCSAGLTVAHYATKIGNFDARMDS